MIRLCAALALAVLTACASGPSPEVRPLESAASLGQFRLGHNIALADEAERGPVSRGFSDTALEAALQDSVAARLRRYDGDGLYHLVMRIESVSLAQPGIPVVYASKPALAARVVIYDNDTRAPLDPAPMRFTVSESTGAALPVLGAGNVRGAEAQLRGLTEALAAEIEAWLMGNAEWFAPREGQVRAPYDTTTPPPDLTAATDEETAPEGG